MADQFHPGWVKMGSLNIITLFVKMKLIEFTMDLNSIKPKFYEGMQPPVKQLLPGILGIYMLGILIISLTCVVLIVCNKNDWQLQYSELR